jgi:hypothetical protein
MQHCDKCDECYTYARENIIFLSAQNIQDLTDNVKRHITELRMYAELCNVQQCKPCSDILERTAYSEDNPKEYKARVQGLKTLVSNLDHKLKV